MKYELLAPAGDEDKLKVALNFGADAVYFAGKKWGLRAFSANFEEDELAGNIAYAHSLGKKAYITVNIQAHNSDFDGLDAYLIQLKKAGADAIIVSDAGVLSLARQVVPELPVHISTQASASNKHAVKFWAQAGASRVILARELTVNEIKEIHEFVPEVELEVFVHGAMCIAYSGRCLLSNYLVGRDSNRGACAQCCRWEYTITEKNRGDQQFEIQQDERGTYILNSKDLCLVEHLDKLAQAGVTSFKIEGRMKSEYYVANVVNTYRRAVDMLEKGMKQFKQSKDLVTELEKCSHRMFTTGFVLGANDRENLETSAPIATHEFVAVVLEGADKDGFVLVEQRNRFKAGEELEVLSPNATHNKTIIVNEMKNEAGNEINDALLVQQKLWLKTSLPLQPMDMLRKKLA